MPLETTAVNQPIAVTKQHYWLSSCAIWHYLCVISHSLFFCLIHQPVADFHCATALECPPHPWLVADRGNIAFRHHTLRYLRFFLSWWAYSFPLAAITIATLKMYHVTGIRGFYYMNRGFLTLISLIVIYLLVRTTRAISCHCICTPEA
ncbi:SLAC1 family transporter [Thiolapillus sp.]